MKAGAVPRSVLIVVAGQKAGFRIFGILGDELTGFCKSAAIIAKGLDWIHTDYTVTTRMKPGGPSTKIRAVTV